MKVVFKYYVGTPTHTYPQSHTQKHTHTHSHTQKHTHTNTKTHTQTHKVYLVKRKKSRELVSGQVMRVTFKKTESM